MMIFQESDDTRRQQFTTLSATFEKAVMIESRSFCSPTFPCFLSISGSELPSSNS